MEFTVELTASLLAMDDEQYLFLFRRENEGRVLSVLCYQLTYELDGLKFYNSPTTFIFSNICSVLVVKSLQENVKGKV